MEVQPAHILVLIHDWGCISEYNQYTRDTYLPLDDLDALAQEWSNFMCNKIYEIQKELDRGFHLYSYTNRIAVYGPGPSATRITLIHQIMITTRIQIDRQTDMPSKTECSLRQKTKQTMVTNHYSQATYHYSLVTNYYSSKSLFTGNILPFIGMHNRFQTDLRQSKQIQTKVHRSLLFTSMRLLFITMRDKRLIDSQTDYCSSIVTIFFPSID